MNLVILKYCSMHTQIQVKTNIKRLSMVQYWSLHGYYKLLELY